MLSAPSACIRTPGLPNELGEYDDTPEHMAEVIGEFAAGGLVNMVGGCCGTTPEHIRGHRRAVNCRHCPAPCRHRPAVCRLAGLEALNITPGD